MAEADETATWAVNLVDGTSGTAENAATALRKLKDQIDADTKALSAMQRAMRNLQGGTSVNVAQFHALKKQIDEKKQAIAQAQSSFLSLGGTFADMKRRSDPAREAFAALREQAQAVGGPVGSLSSRLGALKGILAGGMIALGVVAIAAALVALTAAAVAATAALLKYGLAQSNARRSELLRLEGLTKQRNWFGIPAGNAAEMQGAIDKVSSATALGRDKINEYARSLYQAGLRGENFSLALEGAAIKGAVLGDESAKGFIGFAQAAALGGGSVKRLADDVRARFGGVARAQLLDWNVQFEKMHENIGALFQNLKIEGFLEGLHSVVNLFSQSTASGRALRALVDGLLQPLVDGGPYAATLMRRFFQGMIIGALNVGIVVLTLRNWFRKTFGDSSIFKDWNAQTLALNAGRLVIGLLVGAFLLLGAVIGGVAVAFVLITSPIWATVKLLYDVYRAGKFVFEWFESVDWTGIGKAIVDGLVDGLKKWGGKALGAITDLGGELWSALKTKLGIASPSKVFAQLGLAIPQGVEAGVEAGTPGARSAVANVVEPPTGSSGYYPNSGNTGPGGKSADRQISISFGDINVNTTAKDGPGIAADIRREIERLFEGVLVQLGGAS